MRKNSKRLEKVPANSPYHTDLFRKGPRINPEVAPTSCILRIKNLCENKASLIVLLIKITTTKSRIKKNPTRINRIRNDVNIFIMRLTVLSK